MRKFNIIVNGKSYEVEVEEIVENKEKTSPRIKTVHKAVAAKDPLTEKPKTDNSTTSSGKVVTSPMPGKILKVIKSEGATVNEGEIILILEAMKMENEIRAISDGEISQMTVSEGSTVQSGEQLFIII